MPWMDPRTETQVDAVRASAERELVNSRGAPPAMMRPRSRLRRARQRSMWYLLGTILLFIVMFVLFRALI